MWALTSHERLRLRCILDAVVAHLYRLDEDDFRWILRDCDHPVERVTNKAFARTLDPKGFWRVGRTQDPELRHTVLAQVAFADLKALVTAEGEDEALRRFLGTGPGNGWMMPETLRLADYNLGHDERARTPRPVAERLGPRFYEFQLAQSPQESWAECRAHAAKIGRIRSVGATAEQPSKAETKRKGKRPVAKAVDDLFSSMPTEAPTAITRQQAVRALALHLIKTRPDLLEYEYFEVMRLLPLRHSLAAAFTDEEQDEFAEACSRVPGALLDKSAPAQISWSETCHFLVEFQYVTAELDQALRRFKPAATMPTKYPYMTWNVPELGELLFKAWEARPRQEDSPVPSREHLDLVMV